MKKQKQLTYIQNNHMIAVETRPRVGWVVGVGVGVGVDGGGVGWAGGFFVGWVGAGLGAGLGGGGGGGKQSYVEKRRVSFMNFIVDKRIFLLSAKFTVWCPYRYRFDWFPK